LRLPSRVALLLGVGALSATGSQAGPSELDRSARMPQQSAKIFGELRIWSEAGRIFVSESGGPAQELLFGDSAEARQLKEMLRRDGASADSPRVVRDRIILVGGGGAGTHSWAPPEKDRSPEKVDSPAATGFGPPPTGTLAKPTAPESSGAASSGTGTTRAPKKG
jgi:hypothetical protein